MLTTAKYAGTAPYANKKDGSTVLNAGPYSVYSAAKNNGGTIRANGTVSSGVVQSVNTVRPVTTTFASTVIQDTVTIKDYAGKAVSSGTFAHNHTKPISTLITSEIAGVNNSSILSPSNARNRARSINKLEVLTTRQFTTAIRNNKYNRVTDSWVSGYPVVSVDTLATDVAATPTAAVPGKLTYMTGNKAPVYGNQNYSSYKPKTNV